MNEPEVCPKCGSAQLMDDVRIADTLEENLTAQVSKKPRAIFLKGTVSVPLKAQVCGTCGYAELYAIDPAKLLEAHKHAEEVLRRH